MTLDVVQTKQGELRRRGGCVKASARSHRKWRRRRPKVRRRHCTGKKSGWEDVDDQAKAFGKGGRGPKQEHRDKPGKAGSKMWVSERGDGGAHRRGVVKEFWRCRDLSPRSSAVARTVGTWS
jgi:hypothetical protein